MAFFNAFLDFVTLKNRYKPMAHIHKNASVTMASSYKHFLVILTLLFAVFVLASCDTKNQETTLDATKKSKEGEKKEQQIGGAKFGGGFGTGRAGGIGGERGTGIGYGGGPGGGDGEGGGWGGVGPGGGSSGGGWGGGGSPGWLGGGGLGGLIPGLGGRRPGLGGGGPGMGGGGVPGWGGGGGIPGWGGGGQGAANNKQNKKEEEGKHS